MFKSSQVNKFWTIKHVTATENDNAHQLSFYWEGELRNLSNFLNKRKDFELKTEILSTFNIW